MSLYRREAIWWLYVTVNGQRIRRSTHTNDKRKAQEIHDRVKAGLYDKKESGASLADALKFWLLASPRSRNEKNAIKHFLTLYPSCPLSQITGHDIADALAGKSPATANRTINIIRAAINLAVERNLCQPIKIPRRKVGEGRTRFLTKAEWTKLEAELPEHVRSMAQFAIATGLRSKNVLGLKWDSVDMSKRVAWVEAPDAKGRKTISVPLSDYAMRVLQAKQGEHAVYVFTYWGKPVKSVKTAWKKALERAGIEPAFTWHGLRHTWASWHVLNGTPVEVLQKLGGWSDLSMVMRYAHLSPDHIRQYAENAVA